MTDIKTAAQALVDKLDIALIKIDDAIKIATIHGHAYDGPQFSHELNNLKTALERNKAIDELVKHDKEIGLYDDWGEPFYGSEEIGEYVDASVFDMWLRIGEWQMTADCFGSSALVIYRLPVDHKFYQSNLFKNAKKPDANHPCRGGE